MSVSTSAAAAQLDVAAPAAAPVLRLVENTPAGEQLHESARPTAEQQQIIAVLDGYALSECRLDRRVNYVPDVLPADGERGVAFLYRDGDREREAVVIPDGRVFGLYGGDVYAALHAHQQRHALTLIDALANITDAIEVAADDARRHRRLAWAGRRAMLEPTLGMTRGLDELERSSLPRSSARQTAARLRALVGELTQLSDEIHGTIERTHLRRALLGLLESMAALASDERERQQRLADSAPRPTPPAGVACLAA